MAQGDIQSRRVAHPTKRKDKGTPVAGVPLPFLEGSSMNSHCGQNLKSSSTSTKL